MQSRTSSTHLINAVHFGIISMFQTLSHQKEKCKGSVQEIKRKRITTCKRSLVAASPDSTSLPAYNQIPVIIVCRPDQQQ